MRNLIVLLIAVALGAGVCHAQAAGSAKEASDPRAVLQKAAPRYSFNTPDMKPWHLKASYQFYDQNGKPAEVGTWEYWWASPKSHRSTLTRANVTQSEWSTPDGYYRDHPDVSLRYFERNLRMLLLMPFPDQVTLDEGKFNYSIKSTPMGEDSVDCVGITRLFEQKGKFEPTPGMGADAFCFQSSLKLLLFSYKDALNFQYSHVVQTQGRYLAKQLDVQSGGVQRFSVTVDTLDVLQPNDSALSPSSQAVRERWVTTASEKYEMSSSQAVMRLRKKTQPTYPDNAKSARQQGVVVLAAVIGKDGKIHDLEALSYPARILAGAAMEAVKQWEYDPYLVDGEPVEVETTINVIFTLS